MVNYVALSLSGINECKHKSVAPWNCVIPPCKVMISNSLAKSGVRKFNLNGFGEFVKCLWRCANGNRGIIWKEKKMNFWNADSWKVEGWRLREPNCRWRMYNNQDANYRRRKWLWRQGSDFVRSLKVDLKKKKGIQFGMEDGAEVT